MGVACSELQSSRIVLVVVVVVIVVVVVVVVVGAVEPDCSFVARPQSSRIVLVLVKVALVLVLVVAVEPDCSFIARPQSSWIVHLLLLNAQCWLLGHFLTRSLHLSRVSCSLYRCVLVHAWSSKLDGLFLFTLIHLRMVGERQHIDLARACPDSNVYASTRPPSTS